VSVKTGSFLGRLALVSRARHPLIRVTFRPWWAEVLVAAGAHWADPPDSMSVRFPASGQPGSPESANGYRATSKRTDDQEDRLRWKLTSRRNRAGYRGPAACTAAGITSAELDHWADTDLVKPSLQAASDPKSPRLYSVRDVVMLKAVKRFVVVGVPLEKIRSAIDHFRGHDDASLATIILLSDGTDMYACDSPEEVVDVLKSSRDASGISFGRIWEEVAVTLSQLPAEKTRGPGGPILPHQALGRISLEAIMGMLALVEQHQHRQQHGKGQQRGTG
jgi:DNA-binding transcriptional MerR regulator